MCLFHKWSKWEQYEENFIAVLGRIYPKEIQGKQIQKVELWQKRSCLKCGFTQHKFIKDGDDK